MSTLAQPTQLVNGQTHQGQVHQTTRPQTSGFLPEAACSMTARLLVPSLSREAILVTGRGHTGAEAAQNLRESCAALQEPPPPPSREERLGALLAKGLACAVTHDDCDLVTRLSKAAALVMMGAVEPTDSPAVKAVRSQSAPDHWYEVTGQVCTCPDWERAAKHGAPRPCKHVLAVHMAQRLEE